MPIFILPSDPNAPAKWPGHAVFFGKPICHETEVQIGRGITRSFDLAKINCPECRTLIETTNAMTPPWARQD